MPAVERKEALKEKFNNAPSSLSDAELLELLLMYSGQKNGARETAERLIAEFGSLNGVITAPRHTLRGLGIADNAAILISLCANTKKQIHRDACKGIKAIDSTETALYFCNNTLCAEPLEKMIVITLDGRSKIINLHSLNAVSAVSYVTVNPQEIVKAAIFDNAQAVIIAHNHPHGAAAVSKEDIEFTLKTTALLREIGVPLKDHIIVGSSGAASMRENEKTRGYFE